MLRLAYVTHEYPTEPTWAGGLAQYLGRATRALAARGHDVHVWVDAAHGGTVDHHGVTVHRVPRGRSTRWIRRATAQLDPQLLRHDFGPRARDAVVAAHARAAFDVVQVPNCAGYGLPLLDAGPPVALRISDLRPLWNRHAGSLAPGIRLSERSELALLRAARHVFAPSRFIAEAAGGFGRADVAVVPSPIWVETADDPAARAALGDRPYVLFFGRFQLHKGFDVLCDALPAVLDAEPTARAVVVGRDMATRRAWSMRGHLLRRCARHPGRVTVLDPLPHARLYPIVRDARVVALPSRVENLSNAVLEATLLSGCVVSTRGTSTEEVLTDGESGILVPPGDATALTDGILRAWRHPDRAGLVARARARAEAFSPDRVIPLLEAYYADVVAAPR